MPRLMSYCSIGSGETALMAWTGSAENTDADCFIVNGAMAISGFCGGAGGSVSPAIR